MRHLLRAIWQAFHWRAERKAVVESYRDRLTEQSDTTWADQASGFANLDHLCVSVDGYELVVQSLRRNQGHGGHEVSVCVRDEQLRWCRTFRSGFAVADDGTTEELSPEQERYWWDQRHFADSRGLAVEGYADELAEREGAELVDLAGTDFGHRSIEELTTNRGGSELSVVAIQWRGDDEIELVVGTSRGKRRPDAIAGLLVTGRRRVERLTRDQLADRGWY